MKVTTPYPNQVARFVRVRSHYMVLIIGGLAFKPKIVLTSAKNLYDVGEHKEYLTVSTRRMSLIFKFANTECCFELRMRPVVVVLYTQTPTPNTCHAQLRAVIKETFIQRINITKKRLCAEIAHITVNELILACVYIPYQVIKFHSPLFILRSKVFENFDIPPSCV